MVFFIHIHIYSPSVDLYRYGIGHTVNMNIIIINILTAIGLAPGGSSPVHIYREHYIEYTNNTQNT